MSPESRLGWGVLILASLIKVDDLFHQSSVFTEAPV